MRFLKRLVLLFPSLVFVSMAQSMPTYGILSRMTMIESQYFRGSAFSVDVDRREYWITAKHILTGAEHPPYGSVKIKSVLLRVLDPSAQDKNGRWFPVDFSVIDAGEDIDIVVLAPHKALLVNPVAGVDAYSPGSGPPLGGDCEFLGFPYGGGWRAKLESGQTYWMPFVKRCSVSAMTNPEDKAWVLDGINNKGFSGGPVIFKTGPDQRVLAVVSGYHQEPTEVISSAVKKKAPAKKPDDPKKPSHVNVNSGFIIAYDIESAMDAIRANPIGPLRAPSMQR